MLESGEEADGAAAAPAQASAGAGAGASASDEEADTSLNFGSFDESNKIKFALDVIKLLESGFECVFRLISF